MSLAKLALPVIALALLGGCKRTGDIEIGSGVGITSVRSVCPRVGVAAGTGDVTMFNPVDSREAQAIDMTAVLTNVVATCDDKGSDQVLTTVNFSVFGRRASAEGPRDITLPYFITLVRGGSAVVSKRVGHVTLHFNAGDLRASTTGTATTQVARTAATLPRDVRERLVKKRKAGDQDAAMDPLADPAIRQAVNDATFEALVGFQLTEDQLKYNVTR